MFEEIPYCPKCGEVLQIVQRGMPLSEIYEAEKKGFKFYYAGCQILGNEKTDYICKNCAREYDKDMNERDFHDFEYLTIDDVINTRAQDLTER